MPAIEIQRAFLKLAQRYGGASPDVDWTLVEWEAILDGLERDPMDLGDRLDWVAKRKIVDMYRESEGLEWGSEALHSVDLEYHNIDPAKSLFAGWEATNGMQAFCEEIDVVEAMTDAPKNTRALGRSQLVEKVLNRTGPRYYVFDWSGVSLDRNEYREMPDPFKTYAD